VLPGSTSIARVKDDRMVVLFKGGKFTQVTGNPAVVFIGKMD